MHIDHSQFLELLSETSGIEAEKVTKQIKELLKEINQAIEDGEAFEIDGFGIFSGIGNRILFIPSKELETEINFKYVGMEPIELEENQVTKEEASEEDPFSGLQELDSETEPKRDPFAGLVEEFENDSPEEEDASDDNLIFGVESTKRLDKEEEKEEEEHQPGPDEWGIEAHKEDDKGANKLLSSLIGEEFSEPEQEEESETVEETSFDDIFGEQEEEEKSEAESEESISDLDGELSSLMSEDTSVIPESEMEAGILDEDLTDIFGEEQEEEPTEVSEPEAEQEDEGEELEVEALDEALDELISEDEELVEEEKSESDSEEQEDMDDFDDPFLDLEEEFSEDEELVEKEQAEDIVPVITNISSGIEPVKKEEPKLKKEKPQKPKKEAQPAPVWLWIVLGVVLIIGTTFGLGYFSIINIPGITPQIVSNTTVVTPPPVIPPVQEESTEQQPTANEPEEVSTNDVPPPPPEQEEVVEVPVSNTTTEVPVDQNKYGMTGVVNESANDGYTIVLYSLSVEANAFAKQQELTAEGYRALVTPIASERYGTLWRVSIGQFANLTEAAIASEDMDAKFKQSYFIKKITN